MNFSYEDQWSAGTRLVIESGGGRTFGIGVTAHGSTQYVDVTKEDAAQVALAVLQAAGYENSFMGGMNGSVALTALHDLVAATRVSAQVQDVESRLRGLVISPHEAEHLISAVKARTLMRD